MNGPKSFILTNGKGELSKAAKLLSPYTDRVNSSSYGNWHLWWNGACETTNFSIAVNSGTLLILGHPRALVAHTKIDQSWIQNQWNSDPLQLFHQVSGSYCFLHVSKKNGELSIYNSPLGEFPLYYHEEKKVISITSEIKVIPKLSDKNPVLIEFKDFKEIQNRKEDFCIFQNWIKLKSRHSLSVLGDKIKASPYNLSVLTEQTDILSILDDQLQQACFDDQNQCLPLSGGIDSGTIGGLMHRREMPFDSYTIGTSFGNEFEGAKISSQHFNSDNHTELTINEEYFWKAFVHGIYLNEFTHPTYAEGYVGYYIIMDESSTTSQNVMTGYGADVLLGDLRKDENEDLNAFVNQYITQGNITGEFHPFIAQYFGQNMFHLYWNVRMLNLSNKMPQSAKTTDGISKFAFRKLLSKNGILPEQIIYGAKQAFHTGAGVPQLFNRLLCVQDDEYQYKTKVLYIILKLLFEDEIPYNELSLSLVKNRIEAYDFN